MKRTLAITAAVGMLAAAPAAVAKPGGVPAGGPGHGTSEAAKLCAAQKKADRTAFRALWGKHAMRDCIRAGRGEDSVAAASPAEIRNAAQQCRAERDLDPEAFASTYGTNAGDRNAFGMCVSSTVREEVAEAG